MLNEDYKDMLLALSDEKVRFISVGAYALTPMVIPGPLWMYFFTVRLSKFVLRATSSKVPSLL